MVNRIKFTEKKKREFLKLLSETGNISLCAKLCNISHTTLYLQKNQNPDFNKSWEESIQFSSDQLESEARRRAYKGFLEPIWYEGQKVGIKRKFSDTLLIFLLKGLKPNKFRERTQTELIGKDGEDLNLLSLAKSKLTLLIDRQVNEQKLTHTTSLLKNQNSQLKPITVEVNDNLSNDQNTDINNNNNNLSNDNNKNLSSYKNTDINDNNENLLSNNNNNNNINNKKINKKVKLKIKKNKNKPSNQDKKLITKKVLKTREVIDNVPHPYPRILTKKFSSKVDEKRKKDKQVPKKVKLT